jgi:hypothetical protein
MAEAFGYAVRQCRIDAPITDKTSVDIWFYDDDYPPETWREMLKTVEAEGPSVTAVPRVAPPEATLRIPA